MMWRLLFITACALAAGCQGTGEAGEEIEAARGALNGDAELVITQVVWEAPPGGDGPRRVELGWRASDGTVTPLSSDEPVVAWTVWRGDAAVVDQRGVLWRISREGERIQLGHDVVGTPAASAGGELLAYVVRDDLRGEIRVRRKVGGPRVVARDLNSAGALRFAPDGRHLLFVSSRPGKVVGLFAADLERGRARCLTNCDLRVGEPWGDRFVPPPGDPARLEFQGDQVSWEAEGQRFSVPYRSDPQSGGAGGSR